MPEPSDDAPRAARSRSAHERTARMRRDRRHQWTIVAIALVVGLIAGSLGTNRGHGARADAAPPPPTTTAPPPSRSRSLLFAHVNSSHQLDLIAVVGVRTGGRVGSVVFVPTATLVQVPSFDLQPLASVERLGGPGLLRTAVANALGLRFDRVLVVNDLQLTDLLAPARTLDVDFERSVQVDDAAGTLAYTAGRAHISAADATRLVIGPAATGSLEHLVTVQDVMEGWFTRLRDRAVGAATGQVASAAWTFVALSHGQAGFDTMPVTTLSSGSTTLYELERRDAARLVRADFPDALLTTGHRPRVEILNGTGAVALTQAVAERVVPTGGEITLTGNVPGFGVRHTSVVYYRPDALAAAKKIAVALGVGTVAQGNVPLDVVDVTVVVGADFHRKQS
jgi:hypothetical protein